MVYCSHLPNMDFIGKKIVNLPLQSDSWHGDSVVMANEEDSRTNEREGLMLGESVKVIRGASGNIKTIVTAFSRFNSQETFLKYLSLRSSVQKRLSIQMMPFHAQDCSQFLIFPSCWDRLLNFEHFSTSIVVLCTHLVCKGSNLNKSFNFHRIFWDTNITMVLLFWDANIGKVAFVIGLY